MVRIEFTNAVAYDNGYGLYVNGKRLENIISTALKTRVDGVHSCDSNLAKFDSGCCDISIIIKPQPVTEYIETDKEIWRSVKEMEEDVENEYTEKIKKTDPEE